jgi:hypothetical protein
MRLLRSRPVQAIVFTALLAVSAAFLYTSYRQTGPTPAVASAATTFALVVITAWYAYSTRELLGVTREQAEATRASYAPYLELPGWPYGVRETVNPNGFKLSVVNRGLGVGKNVEVHATVSASGREFRYRGVVDKSLREGKYVNLEVEPHFLVDTATVELLGDDPEAYVPETRAGRQYCAVPIVELMSLLARENTTRPAFLHAEIRYHDVHGVQESETIVEGEPLDVNETDLELAIGEFPGGCSPPGRVEEAAATVRAAFRATLTGRPPVYRERLSVDVRDVDAAGTRTERGRRAAVATPGVRSQ